MNPLWDTASPVHERIRPVVEKAKDKLDSVPHGRDGPLLPPTELPVGRIIDVQPASQTPSRQPSPTVRHGDNPALPPSRQMTPVETPTKGALYNDEIPSSVVVSSFEEKSGLIIESPTHSYQATKEERITSATIQQETLLPDAPTNPTESVGEMAAIPDDGTVCPFREFGCAFTGDTMAIKKHIRDDRFLHLSQLCDSVLNLKEQVMELIEKSSKQLVISDQLRHSSKANDLLFSSQMIWRIDNFSKLYKDARKGKKPVVTSRPFFSHCNGYKMAAVLAPYGDGEAIREHISIFITIIRSDFDGVLPWPFSCPIKFTIIDQSTYNHYSADLIPRPIPANDPFLGRPSADRNPAFGIQRFVSIDDMKEGKKFVKDDTAFIKVDVDLHKLKMSKSIAPPTTEATPTTEAMPTIETTPSLNSVPQISTPSTLEMTDDMALINKSNQSETSSMATPTSDQTTTNERAPIHQAPPTFPIHHQTINEVSPVA